MKCKGFSRLLRPLKRLGIFGVLGLWGTLPTFLPTAFGALPPLYQSLREFKAVLASPMIDELGSAQEIKSIEATESGAKYEVRTPNCVLKVKVKNLPSSHPDGWAGPREFTVVKESLNCQGSRDR